MSSHKPLHIIPRDWLSHIVPLLALGFPIIIGQLGTIIQGVADTLMVGRYSAHDLAAAGFVNNIMNLVLVFALGYSYAVTPVVGPLHARDDARAAGRALRAAVLSGALLGTILLFLLGVLYSQLDRLGQPESLLPTIRPYLIIVALSIPLQTIFNAFKQFTDAVGRTSTAMWMLIGANALNIIGNWLLIYGIGPFPSLGLTGAGISTFVSRLAMTAAMVVFFLRSTRFRLHRAGFFERHASHSYRRQLNRMGLPLGLQMGMETASFSLSGLMQGWMGAAALAAHQVMCTIGAACFMIYYGIGAAVAIRVSHFSGQADMTGVRRSAFAGCILIFISGVVISGSIAAAGIHATSLFTDDAQVNAIALTLLPPFVLYQMGDGLQTNFANALRGIADVKPLMRYAFVCYILVSLPLSYLFAFTLHGGPAGIWYAYPVALTMAGVLFLKRFLNKTRTNSQS